MKPTNYHLFDFLDFDTELLRNESLWKAYKPTAVYEKEGDIYVIVPFQKQKLANDMMADTDVPQEEYTLIIRQYNIGITRLFLGFGDYVLTDESEMLQFSDRIQKVPLFIKEQKGKWILSTEDGTKRAIINVEEPLLDRWSELLPDPQETLDITLYPDGKREIRLSAYDHFSPPRYDALPVAFCKRDGRKERATLSFECKPDECFAGTGERFFKMDLSGQTFVKKIRPQAKQKEIIRVGQVVTVVGALISVIITIAIDSIKGLNLFNVFQSVLGFIAPPMAAVFLFGVFWKRTTTLAANMALTLGTVFSIGVGILYLWVFPAEQYNAWPHFMLLSFYLFVIIGIGMIVVSLWDKSPQLGILNMEKIEDKPARIVLILWGLLIVTMIGLYIFFNGH